MFRNWAKNILFLLVYMISGLVLIIIIDGLLSGTDLAPLNTSVESAISHFRTPFLTNVMLVVTYLGSPFALFASASVISLIMALRHNAFDALVFIAAMAVAVVSFIVLKETFQVARPDSELLDFEGWSFPSGHATVATAFFFALAHAFFKRIQGTLGRMLLVVLSVFGALLVSVSRLYLGAHWTLDVLGGVALGLLSVSFAILLFNIVFGSYNRESLRRQ